MQRTAVIRVADSAHKTRWTISQDNTPVSSPVKATDSIIMQANGYHHHYQQQQQHQPQPHEPALPRYSDYDGSHYGGSQYSVASGMESEGDWKPPQSINGGEFEAFDFHHTPMNEVTALNLDTHVRVPPPSSGADGVGRHLLYETALMDTQHFEILGIEEVDALKKEQARLTARIDAAQRKLALESKVRDAAQNLQRLYSTNKRPDTPQSPSDSPGKKRGSLMPGSRNRVGSTSGPEPFRQADNELSISVKKVDELHEQVKDLLHRRQEVERKLLRHTAAVLAEEANRVAESAVPGVMNGHHFMDDYTSGYAFNDFDGIRDILQGKPASVGSKNIQQNQQYEEQLANMQSRLEQLNSQLRNVISEAGQTLGRAPTAEIGLDQSDDSSVRIHNRFARLEHNLHMLEQQQQDFRAEAEQNLRTLEQLEGDEKAVEDRMEAVNGQLYNVILQTSDDQTVPGLSEPPQSGGPGYQNQLQYMEDSLMTLEQLLQQRNHSSDLLDAQAKIEELSRDISEYAKQNSEYANHNSEYARQNSEYAKMNSEYESTVGGLWDLLQSETASPRVGPDEDGDSTQTAKQSFSLPDFSARVQNIVDRAQSAREQQDILRRQIQQQRDLGGKSDMEKDRQIAEIQDKHDQLAQDHGAVQQELANLMVKHEQATGEASESRSELMKVMDEVEELKRTMEMRQQQLQELTENENHAESKHKEMHENMGRLESEIVRLTTELTMAKAELDGAYGTRAERAGAQAAEVESLHTRNKDMTSEIENLRTELQEMTNEFQELTKESIGLEKEREQLDTLIDSLRERCDLLESQLNDERLARIGLQQSEEKEQRSMLVLKQEFKKMMREQKAEGAKSLRAEQEERRKIEAELRKIRQANGPLAKNLPASSEASALG